MILKSKRPYWTLLRPKYWAASADGKPAASRPATRNLRIMVTSFRPPVRVSERRATAARADRRPAPRGETSELRHPRNRAGPSGPTGALRRGGLALRLLRAGGAPHSLCRAREHPRFPRRSQ